MDLHAGQIQGFFNIPVDNLYALPVLVRYIKDNIGMENLVVVSPDSGGAERARKYAKRLKASLAIIDKRREKPNEAKAMAVIGKVAGKRAVIIDDMADTAGTLCEAADALLKKGALEVFAAVTHPVFSGDAISKIEASSLKEVIHTGTVRLTEKAAVSPKTVKVSVASLIAEAIVRSYRGDTVSGLFI
jgi:ribose-phosphate pyrophosphokinase